MYAHYLDSFFKCTLTVPTSFASISSDFLALRPDCTKTNTAVKQYGWQPRFVGWERPRNESLDHSEHHLFTGPLLAFRTVYVADSTERDLCFSLVGTVHNGVPLHFLPAICFNSTTKIQILHYTLYLYRSHNYWKFEKPSR